jgi:hypothetical protein
MAVRITTDRENKKERGYNEVIGFGVGTASDGMVEILLNTGADGYVKIWMSCERARRLCDALNDSILYHEEFGEQNMYVAVDRSAHGYNPQDHIDAQKRMKIDRVTTTIVLG